jgi:hypothetical protein
MPQYFLLSFSLFIYYKPYKIKGIAIYIRFAYKIAIFKGKYSRKQTLEAFTRSTVEILAVTINRYYNYKRISRLVVNKTRIYLKSY